MRILVTGASGFVGSRLVAALDGEGHEVRAMTRRPERYEGVGTPVAGDVGDEGSLRGALEGCQVAYYLVHSLDDPDFERKDAEAARAFARAAAAAGIDRIVYLGGLGQDGDTLSRHLRSRREVERLLGSTGVPVTVLRAGIVVGHGGVSWELTRQLVAHLPAMVTPRWVSTRTQPIAVADVVRYLVGVLDAPETAGRVFEVGGPEVLTYLQMMTRVAELQNRHLFVVPVPLLSPQLSSRWLALVTDVDVATGRSLIDSMTNEVVVTDDAIRSIVPFEPMGYDEMVMTALVERARERRRQAGERRGGWLSRGARR
ncbi:NAD(P)H-binding protein [Blastococcus litoris]|uniref:NAD(P)H-binding protein n=1 Tax=Blastococcus litoris TaxID=2171622 RepID=UPI000E3000DD|nr:NAD(P)H-binding protein [Blastococcus litoris]